MPGRFRALGGRWGHFGAPHQNRQTRPAQLGFRIAESDSHGRDPQAVHGGAQAVLHQRAPDTLALAAVLEQDERRTAEDPVQLQLEQRGIGVDGAVDAVGLDQTLDGLDVHGSVL